MLTLNGEHEIESARDFAPIPPKINQTRETYPVFMDPNTGELHVCIFWAVDLRNGYEYYGFEKAKGSFKNKKSLVYRGWKMEHTSFSSEFPRSMFNNEMYLIADDPQELGAKVQPPQHRNAGSEPISWERVNVPFF